MITVERQHKSKNTHSIQLETPLSPFYYIYEIQLSFKILSYISIQRPQQIRIYSFNICCQRKKCFLDNRSIEQYSILNS